MDETIFLDGIIMFCMLWSMVHKKRQAVIYYSVTQHPQFDSPVVMLFDGSVLQPLHVTISAY